ncbi:hypothetical protein [Secundilactobacillus silagei]
MPVSAVLGYIRSQYNVPSWIELDVHQKNDYDELEEI